MTVARHPRPPELADMPLEEIAQKFVARFSDRKADWAAFEDASIEGYRRAQHRFIGAGGSGKHGDASVIPPRGFTLSIMYVEPGQGNAAHTHEVEEVFFVLKGHLTAFLEDESGRRLDVRRTASTEYKTRHGPGLIGRRWTGVRRAGRARRSGGLHAGRNRASLSVRRRTRCREGRGAME